MMKRLFLLSLFISISASAAGYAQGFDWQYSPRLPFKIPVLFVGLHGRYENFRHTGEVNSMEGVYKCSSFKSGTGNGYGLGVHAEYWQSGLLAYTGSVFFQNVPATFTAPSDPLPLADGRVFQTEYEFTSVLRYGTAEAGAKYRLSESHFFIGGSLQASLLLNKTTSQKEQVIRPDDAHFSDNSTERVFDAEITGFKRFVAAPQIFAGLDIPLGLGVYASPTLRAGLSLNSISESASWRKVNYSLGISVVKGL